jgi:hypothetical protein
MGNIVREKKTVMTMIKIFCRNKHGNKLELCNECEVLLAYATKRLDACHYGDDKSDCQSCPTHCYSKLMKEKIKEVMRFSGPRMFIPHPYLSLMHFVDKIIK